MSLLDEWKRVLAEDRLLKISGAGVGLSKILESTYWFEVQRTSDTGHGIGLVFLPSLFVLFFLTLFLNMFGAFVSSDRLLFKKDSVSPIKNWPGGFCF